jgi:SAM-dependent methyltransferase
MYDSDHISRFYDQYGEREWMRFHRGPLDHVNLHIHTHYLNKYIRTGDHVLDAGAGPGRFTIRLAEIGASVIVGDISPEQLNLNERFVAEAGWADAVIERRRLDIVSMPELPSDQFDAVVCFGGPVSYAIDRADEAIEELLRVTKPGGMVLLSVMSLFGATHQFLPAILDIGRIEGLESVEQVTSTGDLIGSYSNGHHCHMYTWGELEGLLLRHPCTIVDSSAANFLTTGHGEELASAMVDQELWAMVLDWELRACCQPGALDAGTHIIAVVQKDGAPQPAGNAG